MLYIAQILREEVRKNIDENDDDDNNNDRWWGLAKIHKWMSNLKQLSVISFDYPKPIKFWMHCQLSI